MTNKDQIIKRFHDVKRLGYVKSRRHHNTGIGKTFEDYMGVAENNADKPDFCGYEIKTHRDGAQTYITLFTKSPSFPKGANTYLKDKFGLPYEDNKELKRLHVSLFVNKKSNLGKRYAFKLINDAENKVILIGVYSQKSHRLVDQSCGYKHSDLETVLKKKLKKLFYVSAKIKTDAKGTEYFFYDKADVYEKPTLERFLNLVDKGLIMLDIRIGSYQSGANYGKTHNHESGFLILEKNLHKIYSTHEQVE